MKSRTVTEEGLYEIEINPYGIFLEKFKITNTTDSLYNTIYMRFGQYLEGDSIENLCIKNDNIHVKYSNLIFNSEYLSKPEPINMHICTFDQNYIGIIESFKYCKCGKKE